MQIFLWVFLKWCALFTLLLISPFPARNKSTNSRICEGKRCFHHSDCFKVSSLSTRNVVAFWVSVWAWMSSIIRVTQTRRAKIVLKLTWSYSTDLSDIAADFPVSFLCGNSCTLGERHGTMSTCDVHCQEPESHRAYREALLVPKENKQQERCSLSWGS